MGNVGILLAGLSYLYMIVSTAKGTGEGLSFATFGLWSGLAWIAVFTAKKSGKKFGVPLMYAIGASTTTIILIFKGRWGWSWIDTGVAIMIAICIRLWLVKGDKWGLVSSAIAGGLAAIPFIYLTWKNPGASPVIQNTGFFFSNLLLFLSGKTWEIEDRIYGGVNASACLLLVLPVIPSMIPK